MLFKNMKFLKLINLTIVVAVGGGAHSAFAESAMRRNLLSRDPAEVVVQYGGIGYLSRQHQPFLASIVHGDVVSGADGTISEPKRSEDGEKNWVELSNTVATVVRSYKLPISIHPIVLSKNELDDTLKKENITLYLDEETDKNLAMVSFVGSLEFMADLSTKELFKEHYFVVVSALLILPGSGRVLSAGLQGHEHIDNVRPSAEVLADPELNKQRLRTNFRTAYQGAAAGALARLAKTSMSYGDTKASVYIVTNPVVQDEAMRKLFGIKPVTFSSVADICKPAEFCESDNQMCRVMEGLLTQGATEALSASGKAVLPPLNWNTWAKTSEGAALKMAGGLSGPSSNLKIELKSDEADRKILSSVVEVIRKDFPGPTKYMAKRAYKSYLGFTWIETLCDDYIHGKGQVQISADPIMRDIPPNMKGKLDSDDVMRTYSILAVYKSFLKGAGDVKKNLD